MGKWILPFTAILFLCVSCVPPAKFLAPNFEKPEIIAILPTINQTTDVAGGIVFRNLLYKKLADEKYSRIIPNNEVDSLLNLQGITDGGQLSAIGDEELFKILNVDGLIYVELLECTYQSLGISETRKVKTNLTLKLYPGIKIWEDAREVNAGKSALETVFSFYFDPGGTLKNLTKDLVEQYAIKAINMWLLEHELRPEMDAIINTSFSTLPKAAPVHRHYAASSSKYNPPDYDNIATTHEKVSPDKEKSKINPPDFQSNVAARQDKTPAKGKDKDKPPAHKSNAVAQGSGNPGRQNNKSNLPAYKGRGTAYLTIEAFTNNYFLVYQNKDMNIRTGDEFLIVRTLDNAHKPVGIAEVVRIQGEKVVLQHLMFENFKLSYQDKLEYER